jgi:hypothetical protein
LDLGDMGMFSWSLDSNNVALGFHGLLRFQEIGISLSHQDKGIGHSVVGDVRYSGPWDMTCFKPIDNPFKDKRFDSITIELDTREEFDHLCMSIDVGDIILVDLLARLRACDSSYS